MRLKSMLAVIILIAVGTVLVWTFIQGRKELALEQERERPVKAPSRVSIQNEESVITIDKATQMKSGIVVAALNQKSHQEEIRAYGVVLPMDELLDLRNDYSFAKTQLEKAEASLDASRKAHERLKRLYENDRNISDKTLQASETAWRQDTANVQAAHEAMNKIEFTIRQKWGEVLAEWLFRTSPAFSRLMKQQDMLMQITLPSDVHVFPVPQTIRIQILDEKLGSASFVSSSPRTDPRIQGISLFYLASAKAGLVPEMNVAAYLTVGSQVQGVIVPSSAVVWWQGKAWFYVQKDDEHFIRRELSIDNPIDKGWFLAKGLSAPSTNDRLVVSGAQILLSEEFRSQIEVGEEGGEE